MSLLLAIARFYNSFVKIAAFSHDTTLNPLISAYQKNGINFSKVDLPLNLLPGSEVYGDSAYTDYTTEDDLEQNSQIFLKVMRKKNLSVKMNLGISMLSNIQDIILRQCLVVSLLFFQNQFMLLLTKGFYSNYKHSFLQSPLIDKASASVSSIS